MSKRMKLKDARGRALKEPQNFEQAISKDDVQDRRGSLRELLLKSKKT